MSVEEVDSEDDVTAESGWNSSGSDCSEADDDDEVDVEEKRVVSIIRKCREVGQNIVSSMNQRHPATGAKVHLFTADEASTFSPTACSCRNISLLG